MASQNSTVLISSIYNSRKTVLDLMDKQGYNINDYANFSISEVNSMKQNNQLDMLLETSDENITPETPKRKIYIRYYLGVRPAPKNIQEMIDDLFVLSETLQKTDTLFIIIKDEANETLINELKHIWESEGIFIVIESIKRLQFNILEHVLVPHHTILKETEVDDIMKRYNITNKFQFPDISRFDPVARVIGLRPGQVCKIIRPSKTSIEANYYRICV
uniref:RNA polymerase subunit H/Rpb5 C-terminal domain-containing protein n=1 Tax=viral metagenome TaxID=1070528 RepID=A0A6C0AR19_9ZZZZ